MYFIIHCVTTNRTPSPPGDYDGDKGTYIYQPELVEPFKNADPSYADPPADINAYFTSEKEEEDSDLPQRDEEVTAFIERTQSASEGKQIQELQSHLLGALRAEWIVGKYSKYHDMATYKRGYKHEDTIRLANMYAKNLSFALIFDA